MQINYIRIIIICNLLVVINLPSSIKKPKQSIKTKKKKKIKALGIYAWGTSC